MGKETLRPNEEAFDLGLVANDETDHDEDPDVSSATVSAFSNTVITIWAAKFPAPTGNPTPGAGLQEFRVGVEQFDSGQTGTPTVQLKVFDDDNVILLGSIENVGTYKVISITWDASLLSIADGSAVKLQVSGNPAGSGPSEWNSVNIGHIEWNVVFAAELISETVSIKQIASATPNIVQLVEATVER